MSSKTRYLFDSDVLISSARLHYAPRYCQAFWDWLSAGHRAGVFFSIDKVKKELLDGDDDDPLNAWANDLGHENFFQSSLSSLPLWGKLSKITHDHQCKPVARSKFLNADKADAWLISHAAYHGNFVIITNEQSAPFSQSEIKLPDAATWLNVKTANLFDVLQLHAGHNFAPRFMTNATNAINTIASMATPATHNCTI